MTTTVALLLGVLLAGAQTSPLPAPAPPSRFAQWTGRVETGVMAIGGESTGTRLVTGEGVFELAAEGEIAARLRGLAGREVTLRGRLVVRPGVELRERRIITVTQIRRPTPWTERRGGDLIYLAFWRRDAGARVHEKIARLPASVGEELHRRLARRRGPPPGPYPIDPVDSMKRMRLDLETALVAFAGPSAAAEAAAYAATATLFYEWEGFPEGPLGEAAFAAAYLARHPTSALRAYLDLFQLHRLRAAFEAGGYSSAFPPAEAGPVGVAGFARAEREAAEKYRDLWARVQSSSDPLLSALAADIDDELYVYLDIAAHPRGR